MALDVKICGLSTPDTLDIVLARGASHVGFIHFPRSPRHLELSAMADLVGRARGKALTVVVVVDPDDATLDAIEDEVGPDIVQLHGQETPERVAALRERTRSRTRSAIPVRLMKAISIGSAEDVARVSAYRDAADHLLLDAKRPAGSVLPGGNGVSFDWRLLEALDPSVRYMLSGGLDPDNVEAALGLVSPAGIDVSSGVERAPGIKDAERLHRFFDALDRAGSNEAPAAGTALLNRKRS
ncbi:N-(5'-phosphoribosyl)anthranilate isomerase [Aureimonas sp. Leaf454]|uniref:phosphoribosylanthranilate isomerase n=1 Tax=Aureimonas sp. Leaf454 TaxID=1736381 RepID=UPI0006FAD821|nr:phosphoribosylanthranilate isomerase [Aureimonas sp. Leaf454]KQT43073.1 N-(5'-phosphoribosyl)anthranilate isomerase [Aureimonas sp. Leaf454]